MKMLDVNTLAKVAAAQGLKGLETCSVLRKVLFVANNEDLLEMIMEDDAAQGWLWCSLSGHHFFAEGLDYVPEGEVLAGEVALANGAGLAISRTGDGDLSVVQWRQGMDAEATPALAQAVAVMNRPEAPGAFGYRRYWQDSGDGLLRQSGARFTGFDF